MPAVVDLSPTLPDEVPALPSWTEHPDRGVVLSEAHARPYNPITAPRRIIHLAFMTTEAAAERDREVLSAFCREHGVDAPPAGSKHHRASFGADVLRWEQHSEFATYTWEIAGHDETFFSRSASALVAPMARIPQPGPRLVAVDVQVDAREDRCDWPSVFDPTSLAATELEDGSAVVATDFRADAHGFVRMVLIPRTLTPMQIGARVQQLIELETYRTFALLGLPEARRHWPAVNRIETELVDITRAMHAVDRTDLALDQGLLDRLSALAAELEARAAETSFRFGASSAYAEIVHARLESLEGHPYRSYASLGSFLLRRMTPALRTCDTLRERQADLSRKLTRAADLLRTRVDIALASQNRDLLRSMDARTRLQLRLQQTVEGLSVAAISYYVVSLLGYVFKAAKDAGIWRFDPVLSTGVAVVPTVVLVALIARRIRRRHLEH